MIRILDPKEIDRLLFENAYRLKAPGWFFAVDTNIDPKEQWEKATLRVLIQFMGTGETRSVSSTDVVLLSLIKESLGDQVFVDSCFLPDQDNAAVLDELRLPWSFGNSSHHSIHDYDIVLLSNSIVEEKYDVFPIFECSDFPLWTTQRRSDSKLPLVLYGGAASPVAEPLYGKSMDGVNQCLVDVSYIGHAEPYFFDIFRLFLIRKVEGTLLSDKVGTIEALYQFPAIYNPLAYEHVLAEDNWTIKEIKKVDPKAPDKVQHAKVSLEHVNDRAGFEIKTLFNDGNYDSNDIQISYGCSGGRECSFCVEEGTEVVTPDGFENIENLRVGDRIATSGGWSEVLKTFDLGEKEAVELKLKNGDYLVCGKDTHKVQVVGKGFRWKYVKDLKKNDRVIVNDEDLTQGLSLNIELSGECKGASNYSKFPSKIDKDLSWLSGYWYGDGCVRGNGRSAYILAVTEEEKNKIKRILEDKFGFDKDWISYDGPSAKVFKIEFGTHEFSAFILRVRERILNTGCFAREFIGGLIQADGWANSDYGFDIVSSDVEKIKRVRRLARVLGVRARSSVYKRKAGEGYNSEDSVRCVLHLSSSNFPCLKKAKGTEQRSVASSVRLIKDCGNRRMFDVTLKSPHQYYANFISVSNCHEGHAHAWREKSLEKIMDECKKARSHSLAYSYSGYSFNTNFHSRYIDIMWSAAKIYPSMSAIGMRADEIAARPDYFLMNKAFGMQQITMGVEGISDRIRNGYLNKSLSKQSLLDAAKPCFQNKFRKLKLYFILTGREEMSDWEEGVELLQDLLKLRDSYGANTHIKVTFSILCYYPETPIAWDARLAVLHTIEGGRIPYFIEKCSELGVGVKFTSRGCSVAYQQLLLDVGRPMTALLERMWKEKKWVYYRNVNDEVFGNLLGFMKDANLPTVEKMMDARPYDFIFPNAVIHVKSEKWLIEASKLVNQYKAKAYCMATQAKPDHRGCEACGLCKDKKEIDSVVCRVPDASIHSVGDVQIQISLNKPRYRYRFAFQAPKQYDFLRKKSLGVFFLTQFLTEEEKAHVYDIDNQADPTRWNANNFLTYPFHGQWIIDMKTREELPLITSDKRPVNALLKNTSVTQVPLDFKVKPDDMVLAVIEIKNDPRIVEGMRERDFSKIPYIANDRPFEWGHLDSKVAAPMIKKGETFKIVLAVPVRAHLIRLLVELTGKTYYRVLSELFIGMQHVMYMRPIQGMVCKVCGSEAVMDLSTLKTVDLCPSCLQKVVFKKI